MSQENVEIVRRAIAVFNETNMLVGSGDPLPWLREFCDADLKLDLSRRWIDPDIYRGYEGLLRFRAQYSDAWESARAGRGATALDTAQSRWLRCLPRCPLGICPRGMEMVGAM